MPSSGGSRFFKRGPTDCIRLGSNQTSVIHIINHIFSQKGEAGHPWLPPKSTSCINNITHVTNLEIGKEIEIGKCCMPVMKHLSEHWTRM